MVQGQNVWINFTTQCTTLSRFIVSHPLRLGHSQCFTRRRYLLRISGAFCSYIVVPHKSFYHAYLSAVKTGEGGLTRLKRRATMSARPGRGSAGTKR